jgi:hypothetical protein
MIFLRKYLNTGFISTLAQASYSLAMANAETASMTAEVSIAEVWTPHFDCCSDERACEGFWQDGEYLAFDEPEFELECFVNPPLNLPPSEWRRVS